MPEQINLLRRRIEDSPQQTGNFKLGALPSPWDPRDYKYTNLLAAAAPVKLPAIVDSRSSLPPVFNQGAYGTCVAAATAWGPKALQEMIQGDFPVKGLSTAFLYAMCKQLDEIPNQPGTYARVAFQVLQKYGIPPEDKYPYSVLKSDVNVPAPPQELFDVAQNYRIKTYAQIASSTDKDLQARINLIRQAIAREGAIVAALIITDNFVDIKGPDYIVPYPQGRVLGGHLVCLCGYDDRRQAFLLRNTWGLSWGLEGYSWMPYDWVTETFDPIGDGVHQAPFFMEAWTSTDIVVPRPAGKIEVTPDMAYMIVDGQPIRLDQPAILVGQTGRMMLPIRAVAGNMGYLVMWDGIKAVLTKPN